MNTIGIKHLRKIEKLLKSKPNKEYTKTEIRDLIRTNYWLVLDVLDYLLHEKKIVETKEGKYQWRNK